MAKKTELSTVETKDYAIFKTDKAKVRELIVQNLGIAGIGQFDLTRVKMPTGGGLKFDLPTLEGDKQVNSIEGILVFWKEQRTYWDASFDESGGGAPPDCESENLLTGTGRPGGNCKVCPFNQWGSAEKGNGKKCRQTKILFLLQPESFLPLVITATPGSLKSATGFFTQLTAVGLPYFGVKVSIGLTAETNANNIKYAAMSFTVVERLSDEMVDRMRSVHKILRPFLEQVMPDQGDVLGSSDSVD